VVSVLVYRSLPNSGGYDILAEATVERGKLKSTGRRADLVDQKRLVYSERIEKMVAYEADPEEWLRSFAQSFRTAQVGAVITKDTGQRDLVAPKDLIDQLSAARQDLASAR
jgi:hypothetical protein